MAKVQYNNFFLNVVKLLKNDYHLLLLIAGSDELTSALLYHREKPILNGTELHAIYNLHLINRGSCQAFELLLEANEQLDALFKNHQTLQSKDGSGHAHYELHQLGPVVK